MKNKFVALLISSVVLFSPLSGILAQNQSDSEADTSQSQNSQVAEFTEKVPGFLTRTYTKVVNTLEDWRLRTLVRINEKQEKVENAKRAEEIAEKDDPDILEGRTMTPKGFLKPVQYFETMFYAGLEAVFENKGVFYGIIFMIVLIILLRIFG